MFIEVTTQQGKEIINELINIDTIFSIHKIDDNIETPNISKSYIVFINGSCMGVFNTYEELKRKLKSI